MITFPFGMASRNFLAAACAAFCLGPGSISAMAATDATHRDGVPLREIQTLSQIFSLIRADYVDHASNHKLMEGAIAGMVHSLDPHSAYLTPREWQEMQVVTDGSFGGLGIRVMPYHGLLRVIAPIDGTPAAKAGIRHGDLIVRINGKSIQELGPEKAVDRMRGKPGTAITLTLLRPHRSTPVDVTLKRAVIHEKSVHAAMLAPHYGYIRISQFQENTGNSVRHAILGLKQQSGGRLSGLVLDLRNNPGGVLRAGVKTASLFLDHGLIVYTKGRTAESRMRFTAHGPDLLRGTPVIVLINGGSASAAEIVTGALKDNGRALVMGSRSFGKGSVQTIIPLQNGGALKLTTALYYTPAGCSIQGEGIVPNIEIRAAGPRDQDLENNRLHESELQGVLTAPDQCQDMKPEYVLLEPASMKPGKSRAGLSHPGPAEDFALRKALAILKHQQIQASINGKTEAIAIPLPQNGEQ